MGAQAEGCKVCRLGLWLVLHARQILLNVPVDVLKHSLIFRRAFLNQGACFALRPFELKCKMATAVL